jgi:hypothetical protein
MSTPLEFELDHQNYLHVNNPDARDLVLEQIMERSLIDPFRELYPDLQRYTWHKKKSSINAITCSKYLGLSVLGLYKEKSVNLSFSTITSKIK